jgi:Fe-S cluster biogenesis protein NfuA
MSGGIRDKVAAVVARTIRPALAAHGGDIELVEVTPDNLVKVRLYGACATCMGAEQTINEVVAVAIKEACPEVTGVEAVQDVSEELIREALKILRKEQR